MCCGSEKDLEDPRRVGALAVLQPTGATVGDESCRDLSGHMVFFNKTDRESPLATHVKYIPTEAHCSQRNLSLSIFSTGDLSVPWAQCTLWDSFAFPANCSTDVQGAGSIEFRLQQQLLLSVGDGIIGRRVAIRSSDSSVAEGIVGYNTGSIMSRV